MDERVESLAQFKAQGHKALVAYVVGGVSDDWLDHVRAAIHAGADAVEIGIPFSDPVMDGPVIQQASDRALDRGATFTSILDDLITLDSSVPLFAMTYYNLLHHRGLARAASDLRASGVSGTILPDLPMEECAPWRVAANDAGLVNVMMVAPSTPPERAAKVAQMSQGFVYAAARMAVTGASDDLGVSPRVVELVRAATNTPVYVGIGISNADLASRAAQFADGVIVGTAIVQRILDGEGALGVEKFVAGLRKAIN